MILIYKGPISSTNLPTPPSCLKSRRKAEKHDEKYKNTQVQELERGGAIRDTSNPKKKTPYTFRIPPIHDTIQKNLIVVSKFLYFQSWIFKVKSQLSSSKSNNVGHKQFCFGSDLLGLSVGFLHFYPISMFSCVEGFVEAVKTGGKKLGCQYQFRVQRRTMGCF